MYSVLPILQMRKWGIEDPGLGRAEIGSRKRAASPCAIPHPLCGYARLLSSSWATSNWPMDIWLELQDLEGSPSPPTGPPQPSCANRLQLGCSTEDWGEDVAGLTGQDELGFPENSSNPKVA